MTLYELLVDFSILAGVASLLVILFLGRWILILRRELRAVDGESCKAEQHTFGTWRDNSEAPCTQRRYCLICHLREERWAGRP